VEDWSRTVHSILAPESVQGDVTMQQRRFTSYAFFILAVLAFIIFGPVIGDWTMAVLLALLAIIVAVIFYRRGK